MIKNNQKTTTLILVIIFNIALVGLYLYAFNTIRTKSEGISRISSKLDGYLEKERKMIAVEDAIKNTTVYREKLEKYFVSIDALPEFTKKIESLSGISGVGPIMINSLIQKNDTLLLDFETKGSFEDILYLLQLVENLPFKINIKKSYLSKIKNIDKKIENDKWEGVFSIEISGFLSDKKND